MSQELSPISTALLQRSEFIREHVWPVYARGADASVPGDWEVKVAQLLGTERVTVEYCLAGGSRLFAKLYADDAEGRASYHILKSLWERGFGTSSPYRVAEPLGYLAEHRVLLIRAAPGECLLGLRAWDFEAWTDGLRAAARWLGALHSSPVRVGPPEDLGQGVFRLARRLAKAAARHPETEELLTRLVKGLSARAEAIAWPRPQAQTHGRYHAGHVFLSLEAVTVIDLDRGGPADPAKDVAEFLHRLRSEVGKGSLAEGVGEQGTRIFLEEYARHSAADLSGLAYYWSYSLLSTFLHTMRKRHLDRETWEQRLGFYQAEFDDIPRRLAA